MNRVNAESAQDFLDDESAKSSRSKKKLTPLLLVAAIGIPALAGAGMIASGALFTSQATVDGQTVLTATVEIEAGTLAASSPISVTNLLPGDTESTEILLENVGNAGVYYSVRLPKSSGDTAIEDVLQVTVDNGDISETRSLTAWQSGFLQVASELEAGDENELTVTVSLPSASGNELQGLSATFGLQIDAIQARNVTQPTAGWVSE